MPKTIPCWGCKGPGCKTCKDAGVLSVYTQAEVDEAIEQHDKKAFDMLSILGVPKERAGTVWNGIEVLSTRYRKDRAGYEYNIEHAVNAKREDLKIVLNSLIAKDYIAAVELLSEILEADS